MHTDTPWTKSTFSDTTNCVEAALADDGTHVLVRDSHHPRQVITVPAEDWTRFLAGAAVGEFDLDRLRTAPRPGM